MRQLDCFAGIGGFSLAAHWFGIQTTQFVEIDPYCQQVLTKNFPGIPIHGDITTFNPSPGQFDIITAGFPCQDLSSANPNGRGLEGKRSGLFFEVVRIVRTVQPRFLLLENVPALINRGFNRVLWEIAQSGFDAEWQVISAASMGAPHQRERVFIVAYPHGIRSQRQWPDHHPEGREKPTRPTGLCDRTARRSTTPNAQGNGRRSGFSGDDYPIQQCHGAQGSEVGDRQPSTRSQPSEGPTQSRICGVDAGLPHWLDGHHPSPLATGVPHYQKRLKALGNTVVPQCAAIAYQRILELNHGLQNLHHQG